MCEQINKYAYEEEQFKLDIIAQYIQKHTPNDPILYDLEAMKKRNKYCYDHWSVEFQRILEHCRNSYKQIGNKKQDEETQDK